MQRRVERAVCYLFVESLQSQCKVVKFVSSYFVLKYFDSMVNLHLRHRFKIKVLSPPSSYCGVTVMYKTNTRCVTIERRLF